MLFSLLCIAVLSDVPRLESRFEQVEPLPEMGAFQRSRGQTRAVLLIHGFRLSLRSQSVGRAEFRPWQHPHSTLINELGLDSDVFCFAYGQDVCLEEIVAKGKLDQHVQELRQLGYRDIVLVGHSAGGLIARQFVEDHPRCGVTKVIQICSPNAGTPSANRKVLKNQQVFVDCLTEKARKECLTARVKVRLPQDVEFVCVVANGHHMNETDGLVPCASQWPADLREQGIPAVSYPFTHNEAVRSPRAARLLAELIKQPQPRWTPEQVSKAEKEILH
jgi:pimeloyl-ACP methyl ester carboxylesterase